MVQDEGELGFVRVAHGRKDGKRKGERQRKDEMKEGGR